MITIAVLGAPDPEMSMIAELANAAGFLILEATVDRPAHAGARAEIDDRMAPWA